MKHQSRRRVATVVLATVAIGAALTSCSLGERNATESALDEPFRTIPLDDAAIEVAGHGVSFVLPADWSPTRDEELGVFEDTYEWTIQDYADGPLFPSYVSASMGVPGEGTSSIESAVDELKDGQLSDPNVEVLEDGPVDVPGAEAAYEVEFDVATEVDGVPVTVRQARLYLDMPGDVVSELRFQGAAGQFKGSGLFDSRESVTVAVE